MFVASSVCKTPGATRPQLLLVRTWQRLHNGGCHQQQHTRHQSRQRNSSVACAASSSQASDNGSGGLTYKDAGVDIDAGAELVKRIAAMTPGIGGFGGLYPYGDSYLVARTDGVGTKLKPRISKWNSRHYRHRLGAEPLFFLDYFATSSLDVDLAEKVIRGIVEGCRQSSCVLLGGEVDRGNARLLCCGRV